MSTDSIIITELIKEAASNERPIWTSPDYMATAHELSSKAHEGLKIRQSAADRIKGQKLLGSALDAAAIGALKKKNATKFMRPIFDYTARSAARTTGMVPAQFSSALSRPKDNKYKGTDRLVAESMSRLPFSPSRAKRHFLKGTMNRLMEKKFTKYKMGQQ